MSAPGALPTRDLDASCRVPLTLMFFSALTWLVLGLVFGLLASVKMHAPTLLAHCPVLTYGRVQAVANTLFTYGFAVQAGLAVTLWLLCRLGRTRLAQPGVATVGAIFWNLGVTSALLGLLAGDLTGYEGFELPRYAACLLLFSQIVIASSGLATFTRRTEASLYPSQWFLLAALFWFPWILSTATLLLHYFPVRGVMQSVVQWWFASNLNVVWFGFVGLAALFYFLPKLSGRPLQSHYLALFVFWTLALFGSWAGIPVTAPLPRWMPSTSTLATLLLLVPVIGVAWICHLTLGRDGAKGDGSGLLRFVIFASAAFLIAQFMAAINAVHELSQVTQFTFFVSAQARLASYGFFAMLMFAALFHIVPRITGAEWPSRRVVGATFWLSALGTLLYVLPMAVGGVRQGMELAAVKQRVDFMEIAGPNIVFFRLSTLGDLLLLLGALVALGSFKLLLYRSCRACCASVCGGARPAAGKEVTA